MRDLCEDASSAQSHTVHKLLGFFPLGPAALCLRMASTLFFLNADDGWSWQVGGGQWCVLHAAVLMCAEACCSLDAAGGSGTHTHACCDGVVSA